MNTLNGVNIGGWLVIEKWMTPSLFEGTNARNEFELSKTEEGRRRITRHHKTFITIDDLRWMKENGVTLLRVPIGHWALETDSRYVSAADRLDWLMQTTQRMGLNVLLDLHAAPGAQNRSEHSGSGNTQSSHSATKWLSDKTKQEQTIKILERIAKKYYDFSNIWGIQLLNEPAVDMLGLKLARFYRKAYTRLIKVARPGTRIVFSDGYAPLRLTNCFWLMEKPEFPVVMDCHIYQTFGKKDKKRNFQGNIKRLKHVRLLLRILRLQQPIMIGEWSGVLPRQSLFNETKIYAKQQIKSFDHAVAHCYWNYKTESVGRWNYRDQVDKGLLQ